MKKRNNVKMLCCLMFRGWVIAITLTFLNWQPSSAETLKVLTNNYCPLVCDASEEDNRDGFLIDILRQVLEPAGYTLKIDLVPYARLLQHVNSDAFQYDVFIAGAPHVANLVCPERNVAPQRMAFYVKVGSMWQYQGVESLQSVQVGTIKGHTTTENAVDAYINTASSSAVQIMAGDDATSRNLLRLILGRIDAFLDGEFTVLYQLHKMGISEKIALAGYLPSVFHNKPCFSPGHPHAQNFAQMVDDGLVTLRKNGELEKILGRYGISLWPEDLELTD